MTPVKEYFFLNILHKTFKFEVVYVWTILADSGVVQTFLRKKTTKKIKTNIKSPRKHLFAKKGNS